MLEAKRTTDIGDRESAVLGTGDFTVMINADKGMVPELSVRTGDRWVNAHWNPWFRATTGEPWDETRHAGRWKVPLLYDIAGNFPCAPNFGPPHDVAGRNLPAHGVTAAETWVLDEPTSDAGKGVVRSRLTSAAHPLSYTKWDVVVEGQPVHYTRVDVANPTDRPEPFNFGWHNTLGSPFLESGCLIDNNAQGYAVPPQGTEFDDTGRLTFGAEFESLERAPLRSGGTVDLRYVPGPVGFADFVTGAVPTGEDLGWSSVVNPRLGLVYLSFFPAPGAGAANDIGLNFYDLWMNYGGRHFQPWAALDDRKDRSFCLGTENATGYFANGLKAALENPTLLGRPTFLEAAPRSSAQILYGTALAAYDAGVLDLGVERVERSDEGLILHGRGGGTSVVAADGTFAALREGE